MLHLGGKWVQIGFYHQNEPIFYLGLLGAFMPVQLCRACFLIPRRVVNRKPS